jgi:uncharacterized Zn ribbon protein
MKFTFFFFSDASRPASPAAQPPSHPATSAHEPEMDLEDENQMVLAECKRDYDLDEPTFNTASEYRAYLEVQLQSMERTLNTLVKELSVSGMEKGKYGRKVETLTIVLHNIHEHQKLINAVVA